MLWNMEISEFSEISEQNNVVALGNRIAQGELRETIHENIC